MRVVIKLDIPTIGSPFTLDIATKDMDDTMLDLLGDVGKVHVIAAAGGTFDLEFVSVVLVEALEGFDEEEVDSQPWK